MSSYQVSGTLAPDVTGTYTDGGTFNERSYYQLDVGGTTYYLYWQLSGVGLTEHKWVIGATKQNYVTGSQFNGWAGPDADAPDGEYTPTGIADPPTGTATVAEVAPVTNAMLRGTLTVVVSQLQGCILTPPFTINVQLG